MQKNRETLMEFLGPLPPRDLPLGCRLIGEEDMGAFTVERLVLDCNGWESVPAIFCRPKGAGPFPAVLFNHSHGYLYHIGKSELLNGCEYMLPGYAKDLAERGFASFAIDHLCFEERSGRAESATFKEMLWRGRVMWGYMVYDTIRALDYLTGRDDVDASRVGAVGMSMGSNMTQWAAALDERIKACVDICCLTNYEELLRCGNEDEHGYYYFIPGLYNHYSIADINALTAPRPHLALAGRYDPLTPPEGLRRDDAALREAYAAHGAADNWRLNIYNVAHMETHEMRADALAFLQRHLIG